MSYNVGQKVALHDGGTVKVTKRDKELLEWFESICEHKCPKSTQRQRAMLANQLWRNGFDLNNYQGIDVQKFSECPRVGRGICDLLVEMGARDNRGMEPLSEGFDIDTAMGKMGTERILYAAKEGDEGQLLLVTCKYLFGEDYQPNFPVGTVTGKIAMATDILGKYSPAYREDDGCPMGFFEKWKVS